jgi:hypothetical protein
MKHIPGLAFWVSVAGGIAVLILSPKQDEISYLLGLLTVGLAVGLIRPREFWLCYPGVVLGQSVYFLMTSRPGQLILIGRGLMIVFFLASSVIVLVGAAVGAAVRRRWR